MSVEPLARMRGLKVAAALLGCGVLAGCGSFSLAKVEVDPTIVTGSISHEKPVIADPNLSSDEAAIRSVVGGVDPEELGSGSVPWANPGTGSRGAITGIAQYRQEGVLCRRFTASRESFDGVNLYRGETCFGPNGIWRTKSFSGG